MTHDTDKRPCEESTAMPLRWLLAYLLQAGPKRRRHRLHSRDVTALNDYILRDIGLDRTEFRMSVQLARRRASSEPER
ncbi:hypothetical protein G5V57_07610 [Nordella sp. HKS 07]|uniref:hypothetical protein n=1 Tax=Nordella sp. HKS 07 TaxID=2712222 RepID=UPI0013E12817|nr:hypothetical protein [Nordella sp. HKS 07]QIG47604.1 hypothetical protein G5V57_07610 [Nordella sp. HKS 07]